MLRIGLTGGIGSGKSYVAKVYAALGVPVYDADKEAKRLMESNRDLIKSVIALLGSDAYVNGKLNRAYVASVVFKDRALLERLNAIVHPAVRNDFFKWSGNISTRSSYVLEEAALLFESGSATNMNYNIFVDANEDTRVQRIMKRDQLSSKEVYQRMNSQMNPDEKKALSDFILVNDEGSPLLKQIVDLHNQIKNLKE